VNWEKTKLPQPDATNTTYYQTGSIASRSVDFAPRLSLALQLNDRTVIRAGFGWYFAPYPGDLIDALKLGNGLDQYSISAVPYQSSATVFPKSVATVAAIPSGFQNILFANSKLRNPYTQQTTVAIERRLTRNTALTLNLMNSRGYHLWTATDQNLLSPVLNETYTIDNAAGQATGTYTTQVWSTAVNTANTSTTSSQHTSDPSHEHVYQVDNNGSSWYDGAALQVRQQVGRDLALQLSYTFSHAIDDVNGPQIIPGITAATAPTAYAADRGNSAADQRHRGVLNWVWTPTIIKNPSAAARIFVNGWQFSGIATLASGQGVTPLVILSGQQFTGVTLAYLNSLNGSGGWNRVPFQPVNSLKLGNIYDVNARLGKTLAFTERVRATLAFEVYNAFNNQYTTGVNNIAFVATSGVLHPVAGAGAPNASSAYPFGSTARRAQVSFRFQF
jgi:hypothetical protein